MESANPDDGNVDYDDEPAFLSPDDDAVEVVPDDDDAGGAEPMDDEDEDMADGADDGGGDAAGAGGDRTRQTSPDRSALTLISHSGQPVYAVAAHLDPSTGSLTVATGGGDDRAFLHKVVPTSSVAAAATPPSPPASESKQLCKRSDTVSSLAFNAEYIDPNATGKAGRKLAAAGCYDGTIGLYDADTGEEAATLDGPSDVEFVAWHPKGGTVLLAGSTDGTAWMYHTPTSRCLQVFVGHESGDGGGGGGVSAGTFTPDGRFALTSGMDGTLRLWAPKTGVCKHVFRLIDQESEGGGLTCLAAGGGPDGQLAIAGGEDGNAGVVHLKGKKVVAKLAHFDGSAAAAQGGGGGGMDVDEGGDDVVLPRSVEAVAFAPPSVNCHWAATGGVDGTVKVWDLTHGSGQLRHACRPPASAEGEGGNVDTGGVTALRWHPSMAVLLASYADGAVRVWDARDGTLVDVLTGGHDGSMINGMDVQFAADGKAIVVTAVDDGSVKVFESDVGVAMERAAEERRAQLQEAEQQKVAP